MNRSAFPFLPVLLCLGSLVRADSIWNTAAYGPPSIYADHKAGHSGDILTVVVQESVSAQSTQNKESTRTSSLNDAVQQFLFATALSHAGATPNIQTSGKADNTGGGQITNSQSVTGQAAVLVTDVLPNGNLVIEGVRLVTFSGETQYVVLHGLVRQDDISSANTVPSSNVAEARVEFISQGALTDAQKLGWFSKLYETLRPF
jgi:flagellar L-ring protein precursor FlgH